MWRGRTLAITWVCPPAILRAPITLRYLYIEITFHNTVLAVTARRYRLLRTAARPNDAASGTVSKFCRVMRG
jgi:hypothetical protein